MARITVEDCLEKEKNRFALVVLASKRTKEILAGAEPLVDGTENKEVVMALREIAEGKVRFLTKEEQGRSALKNAESARLAAETAAGESEQPISSNVSQLDELERLFDESL